MDEISVSSASSSGSGVARCIFGLCWLSDASDASDALLIAFVLFGDT